ncbi:MAG: hypothetical protein LBL76_07995 [Treponema sp.]|jgi:hypothetical protein|nr:hypothetical protein [Treponema sp.]
MRDLVIKGMGKCIVAIEQESLGDNIAGMLVTSHDMEPETFRLHIVINSNICNKKSLDDRVFQKIIAVHEFTHMVAKLSAISRVRSKELIERLMNIFREKAHILYLNDLKQLANELNTSYPVEKNIVSPRTIIKRYFPDEHFRLGFEDLPVSYPTIFEEFLFSREMFEEYFSKDTINLAYEALDRSDVKEMGNLLFPTITTISNIKAIYGNFVHDRVSNFIRSDYEKKNRR